MFLQVLGAVLVIATMWAALQLEGIPADSCASERPDSAAGTGVQVPPPCGSPRMRCIRLSPRTQHQMPRLL
jgi:hypothetical protein